MHTFTSLTPSGLASRADAELDTCTPEGFPATAYLERDWDEVSDDAINGGRSFLECRSVLIGVVAYDDADVATVLSADDAVDAFGLEWVRNAEAADQEAAQ